MYKTPEYRVWIDMKQRCLNINNKRYKDYGGRGIKVCDEWLNSFDNFYRDIGPRPSEDYSIERKENDGDYTPENCCWATRQEQNRNRRTNKKLEVNNENLTITEWAKRLGVHPSSIIGRMEKTTNIDIILRPKKNKTSKYKGVSFDNKSGKWRSVIYYKNKQINIGRFNTEEVAHKAYTQKQLELEGK